MRATCYLCFSMSGAGTRHRSARRDHAPVLERYQRWLYHHRKNDGDGARPFSSRNAW
jgi:hypothetical protein